MSAREKIIEALKTEAALYPEKEKQIEFLLRRL